MIVARGGARRRRASPWHVHRVSLPCAPPAGGGAPLRCRPAGARQRCISRRVQHPFSGQRSPPHLHGSELRNARVRRRRSHLAVRLRALGRRGVERGAGERERQFLPADRRRGADRHFGARHALRRRRLHLAHLRRIDHGGGGRRSLSRSDRPHLRGRHRRDRRRVLRGRLARRRQDVRRDALAGYPRHPDRDRDRAFEARHGVRHLRLHLRRSIEVLRQHQLRRARVVDHDHPRGQQLDAAAHPGHRPGGREEGVPAPAERSVGRNVGDGRWRADVSDGADDPGPVFLVPPRRRRRPLRGDARRKALHAARGRCQLRWRADRPALALPGAAPRDHAHLRLRGHDRGRVQPGLQRRQRRDVPADDELHPSPRAPDLRAGADELRRALGSDPGRPRDRDRSRWRRRGRRRRRRRRGSPAGGSSCASAGIGAASLVLLFAFALRRRSQR